MIEVTEKYYVDVDTYNYTACEKYTGKTKAGEEKDASIVIGHYSSLKSAIKGIIDYDSRKKFRERDMSLNEAVKVLNEANDRLEELLNTIKESEV